MPRLRAAAIHRSPELIGEVTDALVAFNTGDVLLHSGLHPDAFANPSSASSQLSVPTMLLHTADGAVVAVEDANCGYGGTGPHTAHDLLKALGFADADAVCDCRLLRFRRDRLVIAERDPVHRISPGRIYRAADWSLRALAVRGDDWPNVDRAYHRQRNGNGNEPGDWIEAILRHNPRFGWADGPTVARCYCSYQAAERAGLVVRDRFCVRHFPLVIEQGNFQLLCPVRPVLPSRSSTPVSDEMVAVLELLGLGEEANRLNATSRWSRLVDWVRPPREYVQIPADALLRFGDPWELDG